VGFNAELSSLVSMYEHVTKILLNRKLRPIARQKWCALRLTCSKSSNGTRPSKISQKLRTIKTWAGESNSEYLSSELRSVLLAEVPMNRTTTVTFSPRNSFVLSNFTNLAARDVLPIKRNAQYSLHIVRF